MEQRYFYSKRREVDSEYGEWYRCFDQQHRVLLTAHATRLGKPISVFNPKGSKLAEIRNRKNYLVNGRTDFLEAKGGGLIGSYSRLSHIHDEADDKVGQWRDARSWSEEFKINLVDAIGNALLGSGDVPGGSNSGDTHLLTLGKQVVATLQKERLPFFPDPPKRTSPGKLAKLVSKIVPGELGKSLGEITPPYGWSLSIQNVPKTLHEEMLIEFAALYRIEFLRWARTS